MSQTNVVPAKYRYVAFYDLLADAAFQHNLASSSKEKFQMSRYSRSSIIASALSIECIANCLLDSIDAPKSLRDDMDKLPTLSKIETALRVKGVSAFDRGGHEVQKAADLIRVRNDYVHAKTVAWDAEVHEPKDANSEWMIPFSIQGEHWKSLGIPKQAMFWSEEASLAVLRGICDFFRYLLVDVMKAGAEQLHEMLPSRLEFANVLIPAVFDEFTRETAILKKYGIDFSFLTSTSNDS